MNPASRLLAIVNFFQGVRPQESTLAAWHQYLNIEPSGSEETALIATQAAFAEIRSVQAKLSAIGVPPELFHESATILRTAFSPTQLGTAWSQHRDSITKKAVTLSLQWASWALSRFDETDLPEEAMQSLQDALAAQMELLSATGLPASLRDMLERQLEEMKVALVLYKIKGAQPLVDVVNKQNNEFKHASAQAVADFDSASPEVQGAVQKGAQLVSRFARVCEMGNNIVSFGKDVLEMGEKTWTLALPYFPKDV